ncbi:ATPase [Muricauda ruestringensis]|uniref:ATPase n=1 Tax=Flagellimonas ruestringensis TaxID=111501 RepID=UPI001CD58B99|nr:ATPase [Allomuricauda ruestringensis]MCA0958305.1 ATPase [Allomuricauda ruestringensis]
MNPIYLDTHIHTSSNPNEVNNDYDLETLVKKICEFNSSSDFLISLTDHNVVNKSAYLKAKALNLNIILGVELHIKNYDGCPAYHCHIYFDLEEITEEIIDDINVKLAELYPNKIVEKTDLSIPTIQDIINKFESYEFMLLPHGGQSHATFNTSIPNGTRLDGTLERNIYYNHFDGFTARGDMGLERTQEYFKKLGINEFVNLITCSDNYTPNTYPNGKDKNPFKPTWMLAEPTFNGLRLSLSEQSRLIYSESKPKFFSENIQSVLHKRDNIDIDISLTSGLNVIIGGSSSGKTLLVDSIVKVLNNKTDESIYNQYEINKMNVVNPSGMVPHYLSQNYIMGVVNNISEDKIEDIDIIKKVFPGDDEIKISINNGLRDFKSNIQELMSCVKILEEETQSLRTIPILSRLITKDDLETNIFDNLQPTEIEIDKLRFSKATHDEYVQTLISLDNFLAKYPFIDHNSDLVESLKEELEVVLSISNREKRVRQLLETNQEHYNRELKQANIEEQTKRQNFNKLKESLKKYVRAHRKFFKALNDISSYSLNFDSEEIVSMGHTLYIENDFVLNKEKFVEIVNHYLKVKISTFESISPEILFDENLKKKNPKVHDYDDFENKIYSDFEKLNKKKYKIITKDGLKFENLSPGWKTSVILDIILGYDKDSAPIIIDQPEDNLATDYINKGLVNAVKKIKSKKQIILVSHNATIPMLADAQNIIYCKNENNTLIIKSSSLEGTIDGKSVVDLIASTTDGGKSSIKKRVKKYNLKKFREE